MFTFQIGPALVFVAVLTEAVGLPVPAFPILIMAGAATSVMPDAMPPAFLVYFLLAVLAAVAGDTLWFFIGRLFGRQVLRLLCRVSISRDTCVRRTEGFFDRLGVRVLIISRFVPGMSVVSVPMAGAGGVALPRFALYDVLGAALWSATGLTLGFVFAPQVAALIVLIHLLGLRLAEAGVLALLLYIGYRWARRMLLIRQMRMTRMTVDQLYALMATRPEPIIIDARAKEHRSADPFIIPGAQVVEVDALETDLLTLPRDRTLVVYCACPNEISAAMLAKRLRKLGFEDVHPLYGGLDAWRLAGRRLEPMVEDVLRNATAALAAD